MARTKTKAAEREPEAPTVPETAPAPDDKTGLEEARERAEKRKGAKEAVPKPFRKRLAGGTERVVSVAKEELAKGAAGRPWRIETPETGETILTDNLKIEGEACAAQTFSCDPEPKSGVGLVTEAPVLVGRTRRG
jgi:hypothetical protein